MPKPLEQQILEEEIKRLQRELGRLGGYWPIMPDRIEDSEYLEAHASLWGKTIIVEGHTFNHLDKVRDYASKRGFKGVKVTFGKASSKIA